MKRKLLITYLLLLLIGSIITGLLSLNFIKKSYLNDVTEKLISNGKLINKTIIAKNDSKENLNYFALSQYFSYQINARITFVIPNGDVIADSSNNNIIFDNYKYKPDIISACNGSIGITKGFNSNINSNELIVSVPAISHNNINVITRMAVPLEKIDRMDKAFFYNVFLAVTVGFIAAITIGYFFINSITKPIKELSKLSDDLSVGNFSNKFEIKTHDEIEELGTNFNHMADKIELMLNENKEKNIELNAILSSMINSLLAVDLKYNIMFMNPSLKKILNLKDDSLHNQNIDDIFPDGKIKNIIKNTLITKSSSTYEWIKDDKTYKIYTNIITDNEENKVIGVVIVLQDITKIQKLEKLRSEFVANVSHELKTPLTIIQGFVETLMLGAGDEKKERDRFLNIINEETLRLKRLIENLFMLSEIENFVSDDKFDEIDVLHVLKNVEFMFQPMLEQRSIKLYVNCPQNLIIKIYSKDWFKQMIINLIDNSIKYTEPGGEIKINAVQKEQKLYLSIEDTGKGIPDKDIKRIFERFYRVEKGRSRKSGGTGLGLSIVKHIVNAFNGNIEAQSQVGKGTRFDICIPFKLY